MILQETSRQDQANLRTNFRNLRVLCSRSILLAATSRASRSQSSLSAAGSNLNREFWQNSSQPEIRLLESEIRAQRFEGIISLHTDDTIDGVYGFARNGVTTERLLDFALQMAEHALRRCESNVIDGFEAENGIVRTCYNGVLSAPPEQLPKPFEIVLETPQRAPLRLQRQAFVVALATILGHYRQSVLAVQPS